VVQGVGRGCQPVDCDRACHRVFSDRRGKGEWFAMKPSEVLGAWSERPSGWYAMTDAFYVEPTADEWTAIRSAVPVGAPAEDADHKMLSRVRHQTDSERRRLRRLEPFDPSTLRPDRRQAVEEHLFDEGFMANTEGFTREHAPVHEWRRRWWLDGWTDAQRHWSRGRPDRARVPA
jgi:hypothetical protein